MKKTYEVRYRQFARGRRSIKTITEVREMQKLNRQVDLLGQAIVAVLIPVGVLVIVYNLVRWLCGF